MFNWDIIKRKEIANRDKTGVGSEVKRYQKWDKKFGMTPVKELGDPRDLNIPRFFTPTSVKIATYYLSSLS